MIRKIIEIDANACNGCGLCVTACHEGAIALVGGTARLVRDDYCDGLGDCLPACPTGAISFVEREAAAYNEQAVLAGKAAVVSAPNAAAGCPGSLSRFFAEEDATASSGVRATSSVERRREAETASSAGPASDAAARPSELASWPIEIKLAPVRAPYFDGAHVLVAADCTAFAYADFHRDFMRGHVTLIGCPKLDGVDYSQKLAQIFAENDVASVAVARMEVPCCGGLEHATRAALELTGKDVPLEVAVISTRGELLERR